MADENTGEQGAGSGNGNPPNNPPATKTFTQEQLDQIVQERLSKQKTQLNNMQKLVDDFKNNKSVTEEQQNQLQEQIRHLEKTILTKEELSAKEKKELQSQMSERLKASEEAATRWKNLFESGSIQRDIFEASREEAFDPQQFIQLLSPSAKLIEEVTDGKPTGRHKTVISFVGQDKDGNAVQMELSPAETVKEMKKMTGKYGNLFKSGLNSGLGGNNAGGTGKELTDADLHDHDSYMKHRAELKK